MERLLSFIASVWRRCRDDSVPLRQTLVYFLLIAAIFYLLGAQYPKSDYRRLQNELEDARDGNRLYAEKIAQQNRELNRARAQAALDQKTMALLNAQMEDLLGENIRQQERTLFYRQLFSNKTPDGEISVHNLEASPDFSPQQWRLNAILLRQGKNRKKFKGFYYYEVAFADDAGGTVRHPAEDRPFEMDLYYEAEEIVLLQTDADIKNLRIIVLDAKKRPVVSDERLQRDNDGDETTPANVGDDTAPAENPGKI